MVALKSLLVLGGVFISEAFAIHVNFLIPYSGGQGRHKTRSTHGMSVAQDQVARIVSNMYLWSQGNFIAQEAEGKLQIIGQHEVANYDATDNVLNNMRATIDYHVRGPGAPGAPRE